MPICSLLPRPQPPPAWMAETMAADSEAAPSEETSLYQVLSQGKRSAEPPVTPPPPEPQPEVTGGVVPPGSCGGTVAGEKMDAGLLFRADGSIEAIIPNVREGSAVPEHVLAAQVVFYAYTDKAMFADLMYRIAGADDEPRH